MQQYKVILVHIANREIQRIQFLHPENLERKKKKKRQIGNIDG